MVENNYDFLINKADIKSIGKALCIIDFLSNKSEVSLVEIAEKLISQEHYFWYIVYPEIV